MVDLVSKVVDSNEVRKNQRRVSTPQPRFSPVQISTSGASSSSATPQAYADLGPEIRDTPPEIVALHYTPKPRFVQSNVYPQRVEPKSNLSVDSDLPLPKSPNSLQNETSHTVSGASSPIQAGVTIHSKISTIGQNSTSNLSQPSPPDESPNSPSPSFGPHSPTQMSPSRKLQQEFFRKQRNVRLARIVYPR